MLLELWIVIARRKISICFVLNYTKSIANKSRELWFFTGPFNFKKLFDFTSFFQDPLRNAAKSSENFGVLF